MINAGDSAKRRTLSRKPKESKESPRIMGQKHKLGPEGRAPGLQEATAGPTCGRDTVPEPRDAGVGNVH